MGGGSDVPSEKPTWRADDAQRKWGAAGRSVEKMGPGRAMDRGTNIAGMVVGTGGNDKVAKGGEKGEIGGRNGGRWLEGPKSSPGGKRNSDRWGGGKRNEGDERDNRRRWMDGKGIFVNVLTCDQGLWDLLGNFWVYPRNIRYFEREIIVDHFI